MQLSGKWILDKEELLEVAVGEAVVLLEVAVEEVGVVVILEADGEEVGAVVLHHLHLRQPHCFRNQ